jgi:hypothetical protein
LTPRRRGNAPPWHLRKFFEDIKRHFGNQIGVVYDIASFEPRKIESQLFNQILGKSPVGSIWQD